MDLERCRYYTVRVVSGQEGNVARNIQFKVSHLCFW